jgi:hypothetical protein
MTDAWSDDRQAALDHVRVWLRHWGATSGVAHDDARTELRAALAYWRQFHGNPERRAFDVAVAASKQRRAA